MKKLYILAAAIFIFSGFGASAQKNLKTETYKVYGNCEMCKKRIEKTLTDAGVYRASWDIETKMLSLIYDSLKFTKSKIQKKLAEAGHDTEEFQASDETYNKLPACCHYDRYIKPGEIPAGKALNNKEKVSYIISGVVMEEDLRGKLIPLTQATVRCLHTGNMTKTDSSGVFKLLCTPPVQILISYVGFKPDTINIDSPEDLYVILKNASSTNLPQVVVTSRNLSTYVSSLSLLNTMNIGSRELAKAACCNLSESFETNPSVDVSYADAVTGIKQIELLGLSGKYTQLLIENTPEIRGLAGSYGLTFIPGPWIESIQLTKGAGSVANGYESIAGQINIEEKNPDKMEKVFVNNYANNLGRLESTINLSKKVNDKWNTALLVHANGVVSKTDDNQDGFLDMPIGRQFNIISRWKYNDRKGVFSQFDIKVLDDHRQGGQVDFNPATDKLTTHNYGVGMDVQQYGISGKMGFIFPELKYNSIGYIFSATHYKNDSYYGLTKYNARQNSAYLSLIYQSIIGTTVNKYRAGLSFTYDDYKEILGASNYKRREFVQGGFFEYIYSPNPKLSMIAGLRMDFHNHYNGIPTARLHLKYDFSAKTKFRFSIGSGFRVANIFAENTSMFVSSRQYVIKNPSSEYGYGLNPEKAWNTGISLIHQFWFHGHSGTISMDAYHTHFNNQVVVDADANPQQMQFYNLEGRSFSTSIQAELNYELIKNLDIRMAYRWLDVQTNYHGTLMEKPLIAKNRAFINAAYESKTHWKFDYTVQWFGKKRIPSTATNPVDKQLGNYSPGYLQMMGQVTKQLGDRWDLYLGAENITNFMQKKLMIDAADPFGPYFDGSMIWGPVNGRILYLGIRWKIK